MSRFIYIGPDEVAYAVRFPQGIQLTLSATTGTPEFGTLEIDDPNGTINPVGLNAAYIVETAALPTRLWTGFLARLTVIREYSSILGSGRVWSAECVDVNWNLARRVVLSKNGYRPAETDLERLTWLMGNPVTSGLVYSGVYTNLTDNPINVDEADYRWQSPMEILADFTPTAGKRAFAFWNDSTGRVELFYDLVNAATYTAPGVISNVKNDITTGIYPPLEDATFERDASEIFSKIVLVYKGTGVVTAENLTTKSTYGENTFVYTTDRIGKVATATAVANQFLADHAAPVDTITCRVILPPANVNDILEGQRVQVKFSHFPGVNAFSYWRVTKRMVEINESDDYLVTLEMSNSIKRGIGSGRPGAFPGTNEPPLLSPVQAITRQANGGVVDFNSYPGGGHSWTAPTAGNLLLYGATAYDNGAAQAIPTPSGWTAVSAVYHPTGTGSDADWSGRLFYKLADGTETIGTIATSYDNYTAVLAEFDNGAELVSSLTGNRTFGPTNYSLQGNRAADGFAALSTTAGEPVLLVGWWAQTGETGSQIVSSGATHDQSGTVDLGWPSSGALALGSLMVSLSVVSSSGAERLTGSMYGNFNYPFWTVAAFRGLTSGEGSSQPTSGQWVYNETPTPAPGGGRVTFSTAFKFADGSLTVRVDNVNETAAVTSYDGAAQTFTLAFDPRSYETLSVDYQTR